MISQTQIKKLQQSIDKQLDSSPLSKKMKASEIYNQKGEKPSNKIHYIMQTSSTVPPELKRSNLSINKKQKQQKKQKSPNPIVVPKKNEQQRKAEQRQFLITQNKTLKQQTLSLIEQLKTVLTQIKPKKYGINLVSDDESAQEKIKKVTIANQLGKITQLQSKIAYQKRQLSYVFDQESVTAQQAQIKILQQQLQKLQKQKKGIINVLKLQNKGIQNIQMSPQFKQKFNRTKQQLQKIKQEYKVLQLKTAQNQRLLRKKHQKAVTHHTKIKKLQQMIKQNNQKIKKGTQNDKVVTLQMIAQIQNQIAELQQQKQISTKSWNSKLTNIDVELQTRKLQEQKKTIILKDKQRQVRLNDLRIKELKKLIVTNIGSKRKVSVSGDQANNKGDTASQVQGRKRNIIFMDNNRGSTVQQQNQ